MRLKGERRLERCIIIDETSWLSLVPSALAHCVDSAVHQFIAIHLSDVSLELTLSVRVLDKSQVGNLCPLQMSDPTLGASWLFSYIMLCRTNWMLSRNHDQLFASNSIRRSVKWGPRPRDHHGMAVGSCPRCPCQSLELRPVQEVVDPALTPPRTAETRPSGV